MNLTETQKLVLRWLVEEERAGNLDKEEIWVTPIFPNGMSLPSYRGIRRNIPQIKKTTLDALKSSGCLIGDWMGKYSLTDKAYEAVDTNFVGNGNTQNNSFNYDQPEEETKQEGHLEIKQTGMENISCNDINANISQKNHYESHKLADKIGMVDNKTIIQNFHLDLKNIFATILIFGSVAIIFLLVFEYIRDKSLYQPAVVDNLGIKNTQQSQQDKVQEIYIRAKDKLLKNNIKGGIQDLTTVIQVNPKYIAAYIDRGLAMRQKDDHEGAIQDFKKAISLDPYNFGAYNNICGEYRLLAQKTKQDVVDKLNVGKKYCDSSIFLSEKNKFANPFFNRGVIFAMLGNTERAINDFEEAKRIALGTPQNDFDIYNSAEHEIRKIKSIKREKEKCPEDLSDSDCFPVPSVYNPPPDSPIVIQEDKKCPEDPLSPDCYTPPLYRLRLYHW
jgi:tetratricopeptide (TPR) repeat protein